MAATRNEIRDDLRALGTTIFGHDVGGNWNALVAPPITMTGLQGEIQDVRQTVNTTRGVLVEFPKFYGTLNEDVEEWCDKFEEAYITNGLVNEDAQRYRIAKSLLGAIASDWLRTEGIAITG